MRVSTPTSASRDPNTRSNGAPSTPPGQRRCSTTPGRACASTPTARSSTLPASLFPASTPPVKPLAGSVSTGTHEPSPRASSQQGTRPFVSVNSSIAPKDCPARPPGPAGLFFNEPALLIGAYAPCGGPAAIPHQALAIASLRYRAGQLLVRAYHL